MLSQNVNKIRNVNIVIYVYKNVDVDVVMFQYFVTRIMLFVGTAAAMVTKQSNLPSLETTIYLFSSKLNGI